MALDVLVVEDNATNRKVIVAMLERWGCRVEVAGDGRGGRPGDRRRAADLILMDVQMPVMGGIEATLKIREWEAAEARPAIPIVALTAGLRRGSPALPGGRHERLPWRNRSISNCSSRW